MKIFAIVLGLSASAIGDKPFQELCKLLPEGVHKSPGGIFLDINCPIDDPRVQQMESILAAEGFEPATPFRRRGLKEYSLEFRRVYEIADLDTAEIMECQPVESDYFEYHNRADGCIELENYSSVSPIQSDIIGLAANADRFLVSPHVYTVFRDSGLQNLMFRSVQLAEKHGSTMYEPVPRGTYWEITSNFILPPLNRVNLVNERGEPYTGDPNNGCYPSDGLYKPAELRYRRADIQCLPSFGVALTREGFGVKGHLKSLVASKPFYELCKRHNLRMNWTPVRIDE